MPQKMRIALTKLFTRSHEDEEEKHLRKIWALFKKIRIYYFTFLQCEPFKGGLGTKL